MGRDDADQHAKAMVGASEILAAVDVGVLAIDVRGRVILANPHALAALGRSEIDIIGQSAHGVLHGDRREPGGCPIDLMLAANRSLSIESDTFVTPTGLLPVSWLSSPLRARTAAAADGLAIVFRDNTRQRARAVVEAAEREQGRVDLATAQQSVAVLRWLAEVTEHMSSSLDEAEVMRRLAAALATRMAHAVVADVVLNDGTLQRLGGFTAAGTDDRIAQLLEHPDVSHVVTPDSASMRMIRAGNIVRLTAADIAEPGRLTSSSQLLLGSIGTQHALVVPLVARDRAVGAICLISTDPNRPFTAVDEAICADLCRRAALAVDNARLFHAQSDIALQMQQALLPEPAGGLPVISAMRYLPARERFDVGGDWYDLFRCSDGTDNVILVVGDVAGHDLAAATRMAAMRNLLRGIAVATSGTVEQIITAVDANLDVLGIAGTASVLVMAVRPNADGTWTLSWSNAGHVPPLLVEPNGNVRLLDAVHGPILGTHVRSVRTRTEIEVAAGTTVVLYTDGLIERRDEAIGDSLEALRRTATDAVQVNTSPQELLDDLVRRTQVSAEDDTALLVCRLPGRAN